MNSSSSLQRFGNRWIKKKNVEKKLKQQATGRRNRGRRVQGPEPMIEVHNTGHEPIKRQKLQDDNQGEAPGTKEIQTNITACENGADITELQSKVNDIGTEIRILESAERTPEEDVITPEKTDSAQNETEFNTKIMNGNKHQENPNEESIQKPNLTGNRIVDLNLLAEALYCEFCEKTLSLKDILRELRHGLGSYLSIRCPDCFHEKKIPTTKCIREKHAGKREQFQINFKASIGCFHAGIGNQGFNKLLSGLDIPTVPSNTQKYYDRKVGPVVEKVAKGSGDRAAKIERRLTIINKEQIEKMV
uniref:Stk38 protein n=1 Tax=Fopius arisanus TaxID=64838 RepID=A0A0C9QZL4_9HYME